MTALARELNPNGIELVTASLKSKGWLNHNPPAVVVSRETLADDGELTSDVFSQNNNNINLQTGKLPIIRLCSASLLLIDWTHQWTPLTQ